MGELLSMWSAITILLSGAALLVGVFLIKRGRYRAHMQAMLAASGLAVVFLVLYLTRIGIGHSKYYVGPEEWRTAYFAVLISHTILATLNLPLAVAAVWHAYKGLKAAGRIEHYNSASGVASFLRHRAVVRWTVPVWLYVAATGWIIYLVMQSYGAVKGA